ncbi:MAG: hypothetical protein IOC80_13725 [Rhodobacter sp.]|nr:hypothetical protein [Rhodobacter sp.]MCA3511889.1 hypothetical protein [Rhodobacter sp.]MCA3520060.1 hypothetical protein [Rhodobacter sp.]MCA3522981.1 hypothetical protein [Rhodobacter sp.]MCA3525164.1 hypothetical protein [Rhodobacter sp.]
MNENVENLVLEQLRLIRLDIGGLKGDLDAFKEEVRTEFSDVRSDLLGQQTMLFGLATVIGQIDQRVERLERKLGGGE